MATPKFGAMAIRKVAELGWKPLNYVVSVSSSTKGALEPAGLDNSKGLLNALAFKTPTDPRWADSPDVKEFLAFLKQWYPAGNPGDGSNVTGYISAYMTVKILEMCGDTLTRDNLMKQATNLTKVSAPLLPERYTPFTQMQIAVFDGASWAPQGDVISTADIGK